MGDQERIENFLSDFSSEVDKELQREVDFILLFGSAARKEWKRGVSDVDLIIQAKSQEEVAKVKVKTENIFWRLDKKHGTKFSTVCSIGKNSSKIKEILGKAKLYVPFEVFGPKDIDWKKGIIKKKELAVGAKLVASQAMLFKKMKYEGEIVYGRDIRGEIGFKVDLWEKIKALLIPQYLSIISFLVSPFSPKTALQIADKSIIYSVESVLFFLDKNIGKGLRESAREVEREIKETTPFRWNFFNDLELDFLLSFDYKKIVNFNLVKEAIELKYNWERNYKELSRLEIIVFCFKSILFVNSMNLYAVLRADKNRNILRLIIALKVIFILFVAIALYFLI